MKYGAAVHARRGDIDGLRALAVAAVIAFHAGGLRGGFAGVDVFFVISGFLITRIIVADDFTFARFYARRVRRIVPALAIVLAACLVAGWFVLLADEYAELGKHVAGGAAFAANLVLWSEVGYFDVAAATKPLLHLWSLGIEEQFYLAWPLVVWLGRRRLEVATLVLLALSLGAQLVTPGEAAFYAPWCRLWELLVGAALSQRQVRGSCAIGLAVIAVSFIVPVHPIVPTLGAAAAIADGESWMARRALGHPTLQWVGRISYPLYLWHWPLLVIPRVIGAALPVAVPIAASVALAAATHHLVERPIQRGRLHLAAIAAALAVAGAAGVAVMVLHGVPSRELQRGAPDFTAFAFGNSPGCVAAHPYARAGSCFASPARHAERMVVIGDSHGDALGPGLIHAHRAMDLTIVTKVGCLPFAGVEYVAPDGTPAHCRELVEPALAEAIADPAVTTIVLVARHAIALALSDFGNGGSFGHFELADGTRDPATVYARGLADTLAKLRGKRVVFVDQVPELGFDPRSCISGRGHNECSLPLADVVTRQRAYRAIADRILPPEVTRVDPLPLFCRNGACSAWRDGQMMYHDDDHLGPRGADVLAAAILSRIAR